MVQYRGDTDNIIDIIMCRFSSASGSLLLIWDSRSRIHCHSKCWKSLQCITFKGHPWYIPGALRHPVWPRFPLSAQRTMRLGQRLGCQYCNNFFNQHIRMTMEQTTQGIMRCNNPIYYSSWWFLLLACGNLQIITIYSTMSLGFPRVVKFTLWRSLVEQYLGTAKKVLTKTPDC